MVRKKNNVQSCIDDLTNENDIAELLSESYRLIIDDWDSWTYNNDVFSDDIPVTEKKEKNSR